MMVHAHTPMISDINRAFERFFNDRNFPANVSKFPPFDVVKNQSGNIVFRFAVAGYDRDSLNVSVEGEHLIVEGNKQEKDPNETIIRNGIAMRSFSHKIPLGTNEINVEDVRLRNGLLEIEIKPENHTNSRKTFDIRMLE